MKCISVTNARLVGGGDRVVWGAGLFALGRFADGCGLTGALSAAVPWLGERAPVHDRGKVLAHGLLMLAGGGEACSDIEYLRAQPELFGDVASDSTLWRTLVGLDAQGAAALLGAAAPVRERLWADADRSGPLVIDIDSTLVEVHSENKAGAAPHYKRGYGFHPMICSTAEGEPLWAKLRPGNAAANDIADHLEVLDAAVGVLPPADAAGHGSSDPPRRREQTLLFASSGGVGVLVDEISRLVANASTARVPYPHLSPYVADIGRTGSRIWARNEVPRVPEAVPAARRSSPRGGARSRCLRRQLGKPGAQGVVAGGHTGRLIGDGR